MMTINQALLDEVVAIAEEAGRAIMTIYARDFSVEEKADKSPLTEADQTAHDLISERLVPLLGGIPILSEEDVEGFPGADAAGRYWLVDPLDGTKEFIKKNGEFTVNVALIESGRPILGVVHAPDLDRTYIGWPEEGAWRVDGDGTRPITVAGEHDGPWRVVGSRSHASPKMADWLAELGEHEMVPMGSSLKLCLVAEGAADVYPRLGPTSLWDTGAAQAVVEAAGGQVIESSGDVLCYADTSEVLNPHFLAFGRHVNQWPALGE
ncbi:3'(2'),5'-bisphosphate nucleotidase [Guyparkeria sp. SCN-R1]|uniref:3'(2'),5'-bisphosphate nucleotidase CysQ n=1 Tax=Guyparkeria sp. SCN-R1 TaxID=2341113 RepID=UPI000F649075|nr:3'(2'),5'-bisphosphate nucleotidase CysQ [Guyparkeria sp. SCN-R1]RRQ24075.1 3'(2'),5'-bisphosphate nucleotidase [Guyparkeria sp. SCN-R1]